MIIVVDANVLVSDPYLRRPEWTQLRDAVDSSLARVVAPTIVLDEVVGRHVSNLEAVAQSLKKAAHGAPAGVWDQVLAARTECGTFAAEYPTTLKQTWVKHAFEIAPTPNVSHDEVAKRAIKRTRPFDLAGNGYRDTLHWFTLLALAKEQPTEDVVLLSNDGTYAGRGDTLRLTLQEEFAKVSSGQVTLCRALLDLEVPGRYSGGASPAPQFEHELSRLITEYLAEDYAFHSVPGPRFGIADPDWMGLVGVNDLTLISLTSRPLNQRPELELRFRASAALTIEATYVADADSDNPSFMSDQHVVQVTITGVALTDVNHGGISSIAELEVERGFDAAVLADKLQTVWASTLSHLADSDREKVVERVRQHGPVGMWEASRGPVSLLADPLDAVPTLDS